MLKTRIPSAQINQHPTISAIPHTPLIFYHPTTITHHQHLHHWLQHRWRLRRPFAPLILPNHHHHPSSSAISSSEVVWPPSPSSEKHSRPAPEEHSDSSFLLCIWDGERFLFKAVDSDSKSQVVQYFVSLVNSIRMLFRYGVSLLKMNNFVEVLLLSARIENNKHMHDLLPIGVLKDLWLKGDNFFCGLESVHYSELITYLVVVVRQSVPKGP